MKAKQFFLTFTILLIACVSFVNAQVTATGFPDWFDGNNNYNYFNHTYSVTTATPSFFNPIDNPSNQYSVGIGGLPGAGGNAVNYFFKRDNYWYLVQNFVYSGGTVNNYFFRTQIQHTNINPPCSAIWLTVNGPSGIPETPSGSTGLPSGVSSYPITLTGSCFNANPATPVSSSSMTPTGVILPQFSTADIAAIQNPTPGQMVWNSSELCIQVYNGTSWNCIL